MTQQNAQQHDAHGGHISPLSTYFKVGAALFILTIVTVAVSRFDFGPWNLVVAMLIASTKAVLVALFFMHLYYDNKIYGAMFSASLVFLSIFIILTMFDTMGRGDISPEMGKPINPRAVIYGDDGMPLKKNHNGEGAAHEEGAAGESHEGEAGEMQDGGAAGGEGEVSH